MIGIQRAQSRKLFLFLRTITNVSGWWRRYVLSNPCFCILANIWYCSLSRKFFHGICGPKTNAYSAYGVMRLLHTDTFVIFIVLRNRNSFLDWARCNSIILIFIICFELKTFKAHNLSLKIVIQFLAFRFMALMWA